jgi:hypothetical protein
VRIQVAAGTLVDGHRVRVDFSRFELSEPGTFDGSEYRHHVGGMALCAPAGVAILTGISSGVVTVDVEAHDCVPDAPEPHWEDCVEVSLEAAGLTLSGPMDENTVDLPSLVGPSRLRILARGRGDNRDGVDVEPHEQYLVQLWPAQIRAATTIRTTSSAATSWDLSLRRQTPRAHPGVEVSFPSRSITDDSEIARNLRQQIERHAR